MVGMISMFEIVPATSLRAGGDATGSDAPGDELAFDDGSGAVADGTGAVDPATGAPAGAAGPAGATAAAIRSNTPAARPTPADIEPPVTPAIVESPSYKSLAGRRPAPAMRRSPASVSGCWSCTTCVDVPLSAVRFCRSWKYRGFPGRTGARPRAAPGSLALELAAGARAARTAWSARSECAGRPREAAAAIRCAAPPGILNRPMPGTRAPPLRKSHDCRRSRTRAPRASR